MKSFAHFLRSPGIFFSPQVDLFSCSLVFVPVHLGMHWLVLFFVVSMHCDKLLTDSTLPILKSLPRRCLAVVDMDMKEIKYYDSMGGNNSR